MAMVAFVALFILSCNTKKNNTDMENKAGITKAPWGMADGKAVFLYTLTNGNGAEVKITNYGGILTSWLTADKDGKPANIVLGFDSLSGYLAQPPYFGALIGRYGNRIAKGKFTLDGVQYTLATNNDGNHLHGGNKGFDKVVWDAEMLADSTPTLVLSYASKDGEEGYPGNLKVEVRYSLSAANELKIEYNATTDKATPINLTNHSYFNLTGDAGNSILEHALQIDGDHYTPVDSTLIPTGEIKAVVATPFDFTNATKIGLRIDSVAGGYDHNFVLNHKGSALAQVAVLSEEKSGRNLKVLTTEPGLQFYSGNFLDGSLQSSDGKKINQHNGMCLETQHFPNSPNEPSFPSTILKPGEQYHTITIYQAGLIK